ncbi:hypothetical protein V6N13_072483 [Hibiscus sabdariffa]
MTANLISLSARLQGPSLPSPTAWSAPALPFVVEAMSLIHAVMLAGDLGFHLVIFEDDSLALIKKMNSDAQDFSIISALVWEAKGLAWNLHACCFLFIPRGENHVAHALAAESSLDSMDRLWVEEFPSMVSFYVEANRRSVVRS